MWEAVTCLSPHPLVHEKTKLSNNLSVLLEWSHEGLLLFCSLEATVTHLGSRIDQLQVDFFQSSALGLFHERFSQCNCSFLWATDSTLNYSV